MAKVKVVELKKKFGKKTALDNVTLEIKDRSLTFLLGPPGVGKSTLLKVIAGLVVPDSGSVFVDDEDITKMPPQKRGVGMVFQTIALYPQMTTFDNVASPLKIAKVQPEEIEKRVRKVCKFLKVDQLLDRGAKPAELSGGEAQRVAIARAIVREARVYLFDEPLSELDYKIREGMRAELKRMREELGQTMIYATPDPVEALTMADEVAIMRNGRVEQFGPIDDVYEHPANDYVGRVLGNPQMNLVDCSLIKSGSKLLLDAGSFKIDVTPLKDRIKTEAINLILGLRPEYMSASDHATKDVSVKADVYLQEIVGSESILHTKVGQTSLMTLTDRTYKVKEGTTVLLNFDLDDIHLFDKNTGAAVI